MSHKRKADTYCSWTSKMDDDAHIAGQRANGQFTQEAFTNIVKDFEEKFPELLDEENREKKWARYYKGKFPEPLDEETVEKNWVRCLEYFKGKFPEPRDEETIEKNWVRCLEYFKGKFPQPLDKENIEKNWVRCLDYYKVRCYDFFKGRLNGFVWDHILQNWTADVDVWKQLIEAKPETAEWAKKPFRHYHEMVELFGYDCATGESFVTASEMRQHVATEFDEGTSTDQAPVSSSKSQSRAKNDEEQTSKLDDSIGILARAFKEMVDNQRLPVTVEELWGIINSMELDEDQAADAFVFLLKSPVQV